MNLFMENMNEEMAINILKWKYEEPYDFYNNEITYESKQELLDHSYYAIVNEFKELIGFFCIGKNAQVPIGIQFGAYIDDFVDMGLGMNPNLVGKGNGFEFCSFIINFIKETYKSTPIRLTVAKFNLRAIHLYEKLGFVLEDEFSTDLIEFITMVKKETY
ncbi:GNAT family N-acetyltransferase [Rummeliibacillus sp. TYF005]|uniref:GNAT family N-acetyltransferase n=1 Tax=Rummeliibacillus sp. TYF005 TaxID=2058214 RepID=UPI000F533DB5|nr:GNAT family protein [Rummeliibacillus sp. TYF005]RPJ95571.1 N-acetyltransferase [Rummeliibacillus sp. TYF005]